MSNSSNNGSSSGDESTLLHEYVQHALSKQGISSGTYRSFVKEFSALRKKVEHSGSPVEVHMLTNLLHTLKNLVSMLKERTHDALMSEILGIKLWNTAPEVRQAVLELVSNLVVVNSAFTHTCLQLLVYSFLPPPAPPLPDAGQGEWQPSKEELEIQATVLNALTKMLALVPTAPASLLPLVVQHMPHKLRDRNTQCLFLSAVFAVAESPSGRSIRDSLLAAAVEHLLTLDVEIKWEDIVDVPAGQEEEEGESEQEQDQEDIFELEGMSELDINNAQAAGEHGHGVHQHAQPLPPQEVGARGGWEGATAGTRQQQAAEASTSGKPAVDETANKLDSMMELAFEHLHRRCNLHPGGTQHAWHALLAIFERTILNTHRSKFSQFLVFFMCLKQPDLCARPFVDFLLTRLKDQQQPSITRSACAAYLASFLARAAFLPHGLVLQALEQLTNFCHEYCRSVNVPPRALSRSASSSVVLGSKTSAAAALEAEQNALSSLTSKHQVFYASVQAILYVLCYHLEGLLQHQQPQSHTQEPHAQEHTQASHHKGGGGSHAHKGGSTAQHSRLGRHSMADTARWLVAERVLPLLRHPLQPLNVCLPSVVAEFRHQVQAAGIADLSGIAPADEALRRVQRPLEMFFPFDPYLLRRSSNALGLSTSYIRWRHGHARSAQQGQQGAGADSEEDEEIGSEDEEEEDAGKRDLDLDQDGAHSSSSASSSSSDDEGNADEDGSMKEDGSLPSDAMLSRPRLKTHASGLPRSGSMPRPLASHHHRHAHPHALHHPARALGNKQPRSGSGYDPMTMATSYSPGSNALGLGSSSYGGSPPMGESPLVVDYHHGSHGGGSSYAQSLSPMALGTPPIHHMHAHMHAHHARLSTVATAHK